MYLHGSASIVICSFAEGFLLFRTHPLGHSPSSHRAWRVVFDHVVGSRMLYCDYSLPLNFKLQTFKLSSRCHTTDASNVLSLSIFPLCVAKTRHKLKPKYSLTQFVMWFYRLFSPPRVSLPTGTGKCTDGLHQQRRAHTFFCQFCLLAIVLIFLGF